MNHLLDRLSLVNHLLDEALLDSNDSMVHNFRGIVIEETMDD